MFGRAFSILAGLLLLAGVALFSVANRTPVTLTLNPLPFAAEVPLYLLCLILFLSGFLAGRTAGWFGGLRARRATLAARARNRALEEEITALRAEQQLLRDNATPPRAG